LLMSPPSFSNLRTMRGRELQAIQPAAFANGNPYARHFDP
jgi:hypothetical protein